MLTPNTTRPSPRHTSITAQRAIKKMYGAGPDLLSPAPPDNTPNAATISAHSPEALAEIFNFNWSDEEN